MHIQKTLQNKIKIKMSVSTRTNKICFPKHLCLLFDLESELHDTQQCSLSKHYIKKL